MLYIFIDPDDNNIELVELENLDVDTLCDLLRCDATDAIQLPLNFTGYIDGEGAWQGRQKEWELNDESYCIQYGYLACIGFYETLIYKIMQLSY